LAQDSRRATGRRAEADLNVPDVSVGAIVARAGDRLAPTRRAVDGFLANDAPPVKAARFVGTCFVALVVVQLIFRLSLNNLLNGISLGSLYGLIAVGIILIYRTNRIINFAAAAIGAVPAIFALLLDVQRHIPYLVVLPIALIGGPLFGGLVDVAVMRRFSRSPRLITMVVTIGVAQGLAAFGFFIPVWIGARAGQISEVPTPWDHLAWEDSGGKPVLTGNQIAAMLVTLTVSIGLALFLRYTRIGIALRASAENADRASLLGIPVKRVQTAAWMLAGFLSAMAIFFQSPLIGVPGNASLGFDTLLYALGAAVVARMERIGIALAAGTFAGIVEFGVVSQTGKSSMVGAVMLVIILGALLLQRKSEARALDTGTTSWDAVKNFRPIPAELRGLAEVNIARAAMWVLAGLAALGLPFLVGSNDMPKLVYLPIYGMVGVSLVVLTGWAGQISLGQFGLVGIGAAVAGGLAFNHEADFFVAVFAGMAAGVVAAILIGLPAVRIQGLYLAVTTLAFAYACSGYVLDKSTWLGERILPKGLVSTFDRPLLYGRFDLEDDRTYYYVCVIALLMSILAANAFRRNRSGRVLIASRDNQRAAPAYGINLVRTRLAAFAVAGGIAGLAGSLFAYAQHQVIPGTYSVLESIVVFLAAVIGGLTSVPAAVLGLVSYEAFVQFGPKLYEGLGQNFVAIVPLLLTGPLLLVNLYQYPGGTAEVMFGRRDKFLRWVARRHDILVPSLIADRLVEDENLSGELITEAERHIEDAASAQEPVVSCPVCGAQLTLSEAAEHDHLRVGTPA
jgi:branched-chain amino acid transport system permease protein